MISRTVTWIAALLYGVGVLALAAMAVPAFAAAAPAWLAPWADPASWVPMTVQAALAAIALGSWWWRHRRGQRPIGLVVLAAATGSILVLATATYAACTPQGLAAGWGTVTRILAVLVNQVDTRPFGLEAGCAAGVPQALQFARLLVIAIIVVGASRAVVALLRNQADRLAVRFAPRQAVVAGIDADGVPVLTALAESASPGTQVVAVTADAGASWIRTARIAGARVVIADATDPAQLRALFTSRGRLSVASLSLLSPDAAANLASLRAFEQLAAASRAPHDLPPVRALVRIDDPWQGEDWRRTHVAAPRPWVYDAVGVFEVMARLIADQIATCDVVALAGRSPLVLALCAELAQRERERAVLELEPVPRLVVVGEHADEVLTDHALHQERFGNAAGGLVSAMRRATDPRALEAALAGAERPGVVLAGRPSDEFGQLAAHLAARHPGWLVLAWRADTHGVDDQPIMARLHGFGPALGAGTHPLDSWERVARLAHERYRRHHPDPSSPSGRPWAELSGFYRESNVRLIVSTLRAAVLVGRTWGAVGHAAPASGDDFTDDELDRMAQREHESWLRQYRHAGWRWGATRDDRRRRHPDLVPWAQLPSAGRHKARDGVLSSLALLRTLGYHSQPDPERRWRAYEREGLVVTAERLTAPWRWRLHDGTELTASAGDWRVTDEHGDVRSVAPDEFARSFEPLGEGRYRRTGRVLARRATPGETVRTLEGDVVAGDGDWVVRGEGGEEWPVPAGRFAAGYRAAADDEVQ